MSDVYGPISPHTRFCTWVKITVDLYARYRGFSILGREFIVYGGKAVRHKVTCTIDNKDMEGTFYPVAEEEWLRVVPEMVYSNSRSKFWFIPTEFASKFTRPRYNKAQTYQSFGLENEQWARQGGLKLFNKYTNVNDVIPGNARIKADGAYNAGLRDSD